MVNKPITLKRKDFIVSVTDMVANSGLPAFVMADIFKDFYGELSDLARKQESIDYNNYMEECYGNNKAKRPDDGEERDEGDENRGSDKDNK